MKQKENIVNQNSGNALIYVLIAIALFAALGFTLSRQSQNTGTNEIDQARADLFAVQLISYATQAKSVLDQMKFTGTDIDDFDFTLPSESGFSSSPHIHKVYHPQGGGLTPAPLPVKVVSEVSSSPAAGWYMGRFNNLEWSDSTNTDIFLTAYQIARPVCAAINDRITGSSDIPVLTGTLSDFLLDTTTNYNLAASDCAACEGYSTLCVRDSADTYYAYYTILLDR